MSFDERARLRRQRIVATRSNSFAQAEQWDLEFWQSRTPAERLSALVAIREDIRKVETARQQLKQP